MTPADPKCFRDLGRLGYARRMRAGMLVMWISVVTACTPRGPAQPSPTSVSGAAAPPGTPGTPEAGPPLASLPETDFGGARWGFVVASSQSGRFVVLRRFEADARPTFGHHGEPSVPSALALFDLASGQERAIDDVIDVDRSRRWMLLLEGRELWLVDSVTGEWQALPDVDMGRDANHCLPHRQASFSATGGRVGWVRAGAASFTVRDLVTEDEWSIPATGRLWRAWPLDDRRAAVLAEVAAGGTDWPQERTSCACLWCNRFAASYGRYGWSGPPFTLTNVDESGTRAASAGPPEGDGRWHGDSDDGCTLSPASEQDALERGPWRWRCPKP